VPQSPSIAVEVGCGGPDGVAGMEGMDETRPRREEGLETKVYGPAGPAFVIAASDAMDGLGENISGRNEAVLESCSGEAGAGTVQSGSEQGSSTEPATITVRRHGCQDGVNCQPRDAARCPSPAQTPGDRSCSPDKHSEAAQPRDEDGDDRGEEETEGGTRGAEIRDAVQPGVKAGSRSEASAKRNGDWDGVLTDSKALMQAVKSHARAPLVTARAPRDAKACDLAPPRGRDSLIVIVRCIEAVLCLRGSASDADPCCIRIGRARRIRRTNGIER
jgi:hypothetical protein